MRMQTKGKCKYCGKEYTKAYMLRHLKNCEKWQAILAGEKGGKKCGYFELSVYGKYEKQYWLLIEIRDDAMLKDLDAFLRDIWVECCGHLSSFVIKGVSYDSMPYEDSFWGEPAENMNHKLKSVLETGMKFRYEYDFGSTTELVIEVCGYREGLQKREKLTLLSRNNPPEYLCGECGQKAATVVCTECLYEGGGFLCDECGEKHECGEEMQMPICNSPRFGVCGYSGSEIYPDQFVPDCDGGK